MFLLFQDDNLLLMMSRLEGWTHRLYPKFNFDDVLEKVEHLAKKREVRVRILFYSIDWLIDW